jgi:hypothetical protein
LAALGTVAALASLAGTAISVGASIYGGYEEREAANAVAQQEEARGDAEFAASQRRAEERKLEAALILSRQQAVAAASGGGAGSDAPTIVRLMEQTAGRAAYGRESEIYAGRTTQKAYYGSAAARRRGGRASFLGGILSGVGTGIGGIGRFAEIRAA